MFHAKLQHKVKETHPWLCRLHHIDKIVELYLSIDPFSPVESSLFPHGLGEAITLFVVKDLRLAKSTFADVVRLHESRRNHLSVPVTHIDHLLLHTKCPLSSDAPHHA